MIAMTAAPRPFRDCIGANISFGTRQLLRIDAQGSISVHRTRLHRAGRLGNSACAPGHAGDGWRGKVTGKQSSSRGGKIGHEKLEGTYVLEADCSGTMTFGSVASPGGQIHWDV